MGKRLITQRRGRGARGVYSSPSHRHKGGKDGIKYLPTDRAKSKIVELKHDPGRTAPIAKAKVTSGEHTGKTYKLLTAEGMYVDQEVSIGDNSDIVIGNILPIHAIPEGTPIFNIESQPGDGGKFVRAGGTMASVVSHGVRTVVQLPSGQFKPFHPNCRATIGVVAGGGRKEKPYVRAGKKFLAFRSRAKKYPRVSGVAMNPVDHPHGGGAHQHVGKPSTVSKHAPPGRKVGHLSPKKGKKKRKK
jgi:large subunit ribosomal protein L2